MKNPNVSVVIFVIVTSVASVAIDASVTVAASVATVAVFLTSFPPHIQFVLHLPVTNCGKFEILYNPFAKYLYQSWRTEDQNSVILSQSTTVMFKHFFPWCSTVNHISLAIQ